MCLKFNKTANKKPLASLRFWVQALASIRQGDGMGLTFRAINNDQRSIPNMNPLYWKWI